MALTAAQVTQVAIGVGSLLAIAKFVPNQMVKAAALGAVGVIVARQLPFVGPALSVPAVTA